MTKSLLVILIMVELSFPCEKKILARWKQKTTFALMRFVTKIDWFFQSKFQTKKLKTRWICCLQFIKTIYITCIWTIFTGICFTKQRIKTKNTFATGVYNILVVEKCWQKIKKFAWAFMVNICKIRKSNKWV